MRWLDKIALRVRSLFRKSLVERELADEVQFHLQQEIAERRAKGMSADQARAAAMLEFGGVEQVKEECRDARGVGWMETLWQDVRYACRLLRKSPGFTVIAILTLALGIGANTAVFSVVDGVLLSALPYPHPSRLVEISEFELPFGGSSIPYLNFLDWVRLNHTLQALAAYRQNIFSLTGLGEPERVHAVQVSASFFPLLGVRPVIGRNFTPAEDKRGAAPVVMLSEGFWKRKFGGSPGIIGRTITLEGAGATVVGVIPSNFYFCCENTNFRLGDVYTPIGSWSNKAFYSRTNHMGMYAVGRLKAGVSLARARADMDAVARDLAAAYPDADRRSGIRLTPLKEAMVGDVRPMLLLLLAAVGFVLLITCVNVANLLLARATGRSREFAIRGALGAGRGRMIRQVLTEGVLLALGGGAFGLLLAAAGTRAALAALPATLPRAAEVGIDARVLGFTLAASVLAGLLFGLAPAIRASRANVQELLKETGRGGSGARYRTQAIFVMTEVALAVVLLIGAGLAIRSMVALWNVNPGFDPHDVLGFGVALPASIAKLPPDEFRAALVRLRRTLAAVPGVEAVSSEDGAVPLDGDDETPFWVEGRPKPATQSEMDVALFYLVSPDYLKVMNIPLLRGRFFTEQDDAHAPHVAVIDENFARKYFPNENPIGRRINFAGITEQFEIVGVVGHVMQFGLDAPGPVRIGLYVPVVQLPDKSVNEPLAGFVVRTRTTASAGARAAMASAVERENSEQIPFSFQSMNELIADSLASRSFAMILLGAFACAALLLASIGIYGVMSYVASERLHELAIRVALGAGAEEVLRLVLWQGVRVALAGVGLGVVAALAFTRLMKSFLFGVSSADPVTFCLVAGVLSFVAVLACCGPARRAMRVDPMTALRHE